MNEKEYNSVDRRLKLIKIILFSSGNAYGIYLNRKLARNYKYSGYDYLGVYTKQKLKKEFPEISIKLSYENVERYIKDLLKIIYRKEKINKLLNEI